MEDNPYQPPTFDELPSMGDDPGPISGGTTLSEKEIRAFVGKKADYYLRKWASSLATNGPVRRFNTAAFFLSVFWISYRKMYRVLIIIFAVIAGESVLEEAAMAAGVASDRTLEGIGRVIGLGFSVVCGVFGNDWYLAHARREIARIRAIELQEDAYYAALARRGGTSYLAMLGLLLLFFAGTIMVVLALQFLLFSP